ncbi:hypothetical protein Tco_0524993 [Tanacetum coccineum]
MAALRYRDEHNKVGYLQKPKGSDDYHQILDFLGASHIRYALTHDPIIFDSLVKQFWSTATLRSPELGPPAILATIDKTPYTITEESVRSQLQLVDDGGIDDLPIVEIYSGMDNLGYVTEGKLTFFKNKFSPQWRFLVHTLLHCLSTKSGSWDQFGSSIAVALICLSDGRRFNWSSYIFKGMVSNIGNAKKFLMYPRFLQAILGIETSITRQYHVFKLSSKLFANMKLNFVGQTMPLLDAMLSQAQEGEGAGADVQAVPPPIPETIPETRHESDHSQDHVSTPTRPQATPHVAPVFEHDQQTEPNIASSSRIHETEDDSLGGSFHVSPPRFTQASPTGHASGGAEDHITLSALSSAVSTLVKKVHSLETELKAHKKLFKDVVPKLVKKVKALEVKLKTKKRKVVLSDSDQEDGGEPVVDFLSKFGGNVKSKKMRKSMLKQEFSEFRIGDAGEFALMGVTSKASSDISNFPFPSPLKGSPPPYLALNLSPLVWPTNTVDDVTRPKEYVELTLAETIQADCDIKAINIILQGLPTEIYALVSQHRVAKDIWEKIRLLMQGTSLTKQERECKLYDVFDKFTYKKGESLHEYYLRFTLLLNDMNIYKMPLEQLQVNTKFLNTLPAE